MAFLLGALYFLKAFDFVNSIVMQARFTKIILVRAVT
jgi:hypothetical protein